MTAWMYEHVELPESDYPGGIYRAVGTTDTSVTLLHVADAEGRRMHTGRTVSISQERYEELPAASNPDESRSLLAALRSLPTAAYWGVRTYSRQWAARPVSSSLAAAAAVVGAISPAGLPLSPLVLDMLFIGGVISLVAVGEGAGSSDENQ